MWADFKTVMYLSEPQKTSGLLINLGLLSSDRHYNLTKNLYLKISVRRPIKHLNKFLFKNAKNSSDCERLTWFKILKKNV